MYLKLGDIEVSKKPLCMAPWKGLYVSPHGLSPCCHIAPKDIYDMEEYMESDYLVALKKAHMEHDIANMDVKCKICVNKKHTLFGEMGYGKDPVLTKQWDEGDTDFSHINVAISSKCSMSCKMCLISDKRFNELKVHGTEVLGLGPKTLDYIINDFDIVGLVKERGDSIRYLSLFGGDPAMHNTTPSILNVLEPTTIVRYSCNGKLGKLTDGSDLVETLNKFNRVSLSFSIDALGDLGKYIRGGIDYKRFDELYFKTAKLKEKYWVGISLTVSLWNVMLLPSIFEDIYNKYIEGNDHILIFMTSVVDPSYASIANLPYKLKMNLRKKCKEHLDSLKSSGDIRKYEMFQSLLEQYEYSIVEPFNKAGWERFVYLEQNHEITRGYNIKQFVSDYEGYL